MADNKAVTYRQAFLCPTGTVDVCGQDRRGLDWGPGACPGHRCLPAWAASEAHHPSTVKWKPWQSFGFHQEDAEAVRCGLHSGSPPLPLAGRAVTVGSGFVGLTQSSAHHQGASYDALRGIPSSCHPPRRLRLYTE